MPSLKLLLEDVLDNLEDAEDGISGEVAPVFEDDRTVVLEYIDTALSRIDTALSELQDAGAADTDQMSFSLESIARACVELAQEALCEGESPHPIDNQIGDRLKTIQYLIRMTPGGFRDLAR